MKESPLRKCVSCGEMIPRENMLRVVKTKESKIFIDIKKPSHGCEMVKSLPLTLTSGFSLLFALHAGLFVMFALANFLENAAAGALPLKPFERTFQGLIFTKTHLRHFYPSLRSKQRFNRKPGERAKPWGHYSATETLRQSLFYPEALRPFYRPSARRPGCENAGG